MIVDLSSVGRQKINFLAFPYLRSQRALFPLGMQMSSKLSQKKCVAKKFNNDHHEAVHLHSTERSLKEALFPLVRVKARMGVSLCLCWWWDVSIFFVLSIATTVVERGNTHTHSWRQRGLALAVLLYKHTDVVFTLTNSPRRKSFITNSRTIEQALSTCLLSLKFLTSI
jgi:hypothetical protein